MPLERLAGRDIFVLRTGDAAGTVLLHCTLARHEALLPLVQALDIPAILTDLIGHGRSADWDGQGDYQTANMQATAALCDGPMHLIGHSFGATVALRLAVEHPEKVSRLTLIEPVYFALATDPVARADHLADFAPVQAACDAGDLALAARLFHGEWGAGDWAALPAQTRDGFTRRMPLILAGLPAMQDDPFDVAGRLADLRMPVTLIRGELTPHIVPAIHAAICAAVPQARDHVVSGASHMVPLTHVATVAAIIAGDA